MALLGWFDTSELEDFGTVLANDLAQRFPPASEARTDTGAKYQLKVILEGLGARAVRFHDEKKLSVYKKAKLANVFKWRLKELGYTEGFVDNATKEIVNRLAAN